MNVLEIKPLVDIKILRETCSRIGIANNKDKILYPSCYIYTEEDKFYLIHFKQYFGLTRENAYDNTSPEDTLRRNAIAWLLCSWKLIECNMDEIVNHNKYVFVLAHKNKNEWKIENKINMRQR